MPAMPWRLARDCPQALQNRLANIDVHPPRVAVGSGAPTNPADRAWSPLRRIPGASPPSAGALRCCGFRTAPIAGSVCKGWSKCFPAASRTCRYCIRERLPGTRHRSIQRECLEHVVVLNAAGSNAPFRSTCVLHASTPPLATGNDAGSRDGGRVNGGSKPGEREKIRQCAFSRAFQGISLTPRRYCALRTV